jgi:hypothetical protein
VDSALSRDFQDIVDLINSFARKEGEGKEGEEIDDVPDDADLAEEESGDVEMRGDDAGDESQQ